MRPAPEFKKVLIANRGEVAVRIARTLKAMNIASVVVFHAADADGLAVRTADEAVEIFGKTPVSAYLDIAQIVKAAENCNAEAIHPGYGFLSENPNFAMAVTTAGITFIGPGAEVMELMGDKVKSREHLAKKGLPLLPWVTLEDDINLFISEAEKLEFPVVIKAVGGGGGKGMTIVRDSKELEIAARDTASQAEAYFADGRIYCERYIEHPRHIEVQILADSHGNCLHLFERECSIQRRFQKVIEESPAPKLPASLRNTICEQAIQIARASRYVNAGTVEFILEPDGHFYFLEMNTRLQVEHPVTEMVTGIDLVAEQVRIAAGHPLTMTQAEITQTGHAIECRIYAEDSENDFLPATGVVICMREPAGPGVRIDAGLLEGADITSDFDPLLTKLITHGRNRSQAIQRMAAALADYVLLGVTSNTAFLSRLLGLEAFQRGEIDTHFIGRHKTDLSVPIPGDVERLPILLAAALTNKRFENPALAVPEPYRSIGHWRN